MIKFQGQSSLKQYMPKKLKQIIGDYCSRRRARRSRTKQKSLPLQHFPTSRRKGCHCWLCRENNRRADTVVLHWMWSVAVSSWHSRWLLPLVAQKKSVKAATLFSCSCSSFSFVCAWTCPGVHSTFAIHFMYMLDFFLPQSSPDIKEKDHMSSCENQFPVMSTCVSISYIIVPVFN